MNVFQYAAITEKNWESNLEDMGAYRRKYTFYADFGIAEFCEIYARDAGAVKNTWNNVKESWGASIEAITEVCLVLNHKAWSFAEKVDSSYLKCSEEWRNHYTKLYTDLYYECYDFIVDKFKDNDDALTYFYSVID